MTNTATDSPYDEQEAGFAIVRLECAYGSTDCQLLARLERQLVGAVDGSPNGLLIDMGETIYIGCGFLNVLLRCHARATGKNRRFVLCMLNSLPEHVMAIALLDALWEVFRTRQESLDAMRRTPQN